MFPEEDAVLCSIEKVLELCPESKDLYENVLTQLTPIVSRTGQDDEYREKLANSFSIWKQLKICFDGCVVEKFTSINDKEYIFWYLRTVRGIILLMRNLSASNQEIPQQLLIQNTVVRSFLQICQYDTTYDDMETSIYVAITSFLHNISKVSVTFDKSEINPLMSFISYPSNHPMLKSDLLLPSLLFFLNLTQSDDFLYYFFRHDKKDEILHDFLIKKILQEHSNLTSFLLKRDDNEFESNMTTIDGILIKCFARIASSESFGPYLEEIEKSDNSKFMEYLKILQLVITSSESWDKFQLTAIMVWCYRIFERSASAVERYFHTKSENEEQAIIYHHKLSMALDIISTLSQYEHVQKFLLSYNGLEKLISLLHTLQENLIRINFFKDNSGKVKEFKTSNTSGEKVKDELRARRVDYETFKIKSTNFPECKLLIIEILGNLAFRNKEVQDKIRELHGLELVLSNCVIDDNDPFIKERSIVCIRFLLEGNQCNQDFVASLEAQRAVQDDTLAEAGYEVKIDKSGKVGLLPKEGGNNN